MEKVDFDLYFLENTSHRLHDIAGSKDVPPVVIDLEIQSVPVLMEFDTYIIFIFQKDP